MNGNKRSFVHPCHVIMVRDVDDTVDQCPSSVYVYQSVVFLPVGVDFDYLCVLVDIGMFMLINVMLCFQ